ncbi:hypothetical protein G5C66_04625 [Nocardioides sp. KC13]|uniref:Condensation domain-containing protein n=1 Tax=Nocardioides turkmenicus TaxID=2711220 RepID=A0A6M1QXB4_9ACTN|nr:hypothetical protein [Nocardioides sp. KC13]NGN92022.1 hypothetical protein [Nocardioides sp. KC13]
MKGGEDWRSGDPIDRGWAGIRYTRACLGLDMPTVQAVRAALITIASPSSGIPRVYDDRGSWRSVPMTRVCAWAQAVVTWVDEPGADPDRIFALGREQRLPSRFHLLVGPDWFALCADHAFGDGQSADMFIAQILTQAATPVRIPVPWERLGPLRRDRAIVAGVARNLGSLPWMLRNRAGLAGGTYGPLEPAGPHRIVVSHSDARFMDRLRRARAERFPGASAAAIVGAGLRAGVADVLGEPRPGFECLFNSRASGRSGLVPWGNWSIGAYLYPEDDLDPLSIGAAMTEARARGVAAYGLAAARMARKAETGPLQGATAEGTPRLTLSYMSGRALESTPGFVPGRSSIITDSMPNGLDAITFQTVETGGRITVSTAYFPQAWDGDLISAGVRRFLDEGAEILRPLHEEVR